MSDSERDNPGQRTTHTEHPGDDAGRCAFVRGQLPGYALNALEPDENETVARHLYICPDCRAELGEFESVTRLLPYAAPARTAPLRARAALLTRIDAVGSTNPRQMLVLQPQPQPITERPTGWRGWFRRVPRVAWLSAAPLVMLALLFAASSAVMQHRINDQQSAINSAEEEKRQAADVLAVDNAARFVSELTSAPDMPEARGRLFVNLSDNTAMLVAIGLPLPAEGEVYVAWLGLQQEYARLATLEVDDIGRTQLILDPPDSLDHYESFVVTLERDPRTSTPTGPFVFTGLIHPQGGSSERLAASQ